jgi:hypothetical protein
MAWRSELPGDRILSHRRNRVITQPAGAPAKARRFDYDVRIKRFALITCGMARDGPEEGARARNRLAMLSCDMERTSLLPTGTC